MKRIFVFLSAGVICLFSCSKDAYLDENISGAYELVGAEFSSPINLSRGGVASTDILSQVLQYGCGGDMSVGGHSVLTQNIVPPVKLGKLADAELYTFAWSRTKTDVYLDSGRCGVEWSKYTFQYRIDSRGAVQLCFKETKNVYGTYCGEDDINGVSIILTGEYIHLYQECTFYDTDSESRVSGTLHSIFARNHNI